MSPIAIIIFIGTLLSGLMLAALSRSQWSDEIVRLNKQSRRMLAKNTKDEEVNVFLQQKNDMLARLLALAGMEAKYNEIRMQWIITSIVGGVLGGIGMFFSGMPELAPVGLILGVPLGAAGFISYLGHLGKARQTKMTEQLPQVLETMVSSLRAGSPVMEVFKVLAETAVDPIRGEFKRGLVSLQLGKPFREVMAEMATRIRTPDFAMLTQAIFISQDVGGNLAEVVSVIADAIRERFKLRDYMNSLTAQGKATAAFIGCLPYGITLITYCASPGYIVPFINNPICRLVLLALVLWEFLGFWVLMKLCTFEV
jgi:tight adherence protein B